MSRVFAPGCAIMLYKPQLVDRLRDLHRCLGALPILSTCCRNNPHLPDGTEVVTICPGCDKRYRTRYPHASAISLWEVLASLPDLALPDYRGETMSIIDACPTRSQRRVHEAIRALLQRMRVRVVEPRRTRTHTTCCGDSFYGKLPLDQVKQQMARRAAQMPVEEVVVHCVSCINALLIGHKRPRYMVDLLFGEDTIPEIVEPDLWHEALDAYIASH